jgi:hypothetical protein
MAMCSKGKYVLHGSRYKAFAVLPMAGISCRVDVQTGQEVALKVIDLEDVEDDIEDIHKVGCYSCKARFLCGSQHKLLGTKPALYVCRRSQRWQPATPTTSPSTTRQCYDLVQQS